MGVSLGWGIEEQVRCGLLFDFGSLPHVREEFVVVIVAEEDALVELLVDLVFDEVVQVSGDLAVGHEVAVVGHTVGFVEPGGLGLNEGVEVLAEGGVEVVVGVDDFGEEAADLVVFGEKGSLGQELFSFAARAALARLGVAGVLWELLSFGGF